MESEPREHAQDVDDEDGAGALGGLRPRQLLGLATRAPDSYVLLLVLLVFDYVSLNVVWTGRWALIVRAALLALTVLLAFHTSRVPHSIQRVVRVAVAVTLLVAIGAAIGGTGEAEGAEILLTSLLVLGSPFAIGWRIVHHQRVTRETIAGAVCIYVLIGLIFANFDYGLQVASGTSFFAQSGQHGLARLRVLQLHHHGHRRLRRPHPRARPAADVVGARRARGPGVPRRPARPAGVAVPATRVAHRARGAPARRRLTSRRATEG